MEPAAMLIGAFEIDIGWPAQIGPLLEHEGMRRAGIEPDVENVVHLLPFTGIADAALQEPLMCVVLEPGISPFAFEGRCDALVHLAIVEKLPRRLVDEDADR